MSLPFTLPQTRNNEPTPIWNGGSFKIGESSVRILEYSINEKGWNDELTNLHENAAGDNHPIDKASREYATKQLVDNIPREDAIILEVGCSSGYMLKQIQELLPQAIVMGSDIITKPLEKLALSAPHSPLFRFDFLQCPLPDSCIDAVVMLNVLEHIEDDSATVKQIYRILKPGGICIIEVPSGPHLYDIYDELLKHYRRYSMSNLCKLFTDNGLSVVKKSHLGFFIYPAFTYVKKRNKRYTNSSEAQKNAIVRQSIEQTKQSWIMRIIMRIELLFGRYISFPFGARCLLLCRKI